MIDLMTGKRLVVSTDGTAGPYLVLAFSQLEDVEDILKRQRVDYSVEEDVISIDGGPEIAVIDFGWEADAFAIQAILDDSR